MRLLALIIGLMLGLGGKASSQPFDLPSDVSIFCRDGSGKFQPMLRTDYSRLQNSFIRQFGWRHTLNRLSDTLGVLDFSEDDAGANREHIYYDVQGYQGGIALLHMHVRLRGKRENVSGNEMCWRTFAIVNVD